METQISIEELKRQWLADPGWNIENTPGFEEQRTELLIWRLTYERNKAWEELSEIRSILAKFRKLF